MKIENRKLVRCAEAGVFFARVDSYLNGEAVLSNARRIWYWSGAASLSELAMKGPSDPESCLFPIPVPKIHVMGVVEILDVTIEAAARIDAVPVWTAHKND